MVAMKTFLRLWCADTRSHIAFVRVLIGFRIGFISWLFRTASENTLTIKHGGRNCNNISRALYRSKKIGN